MGLRALLGRSRHGPPHGPSQARAYAIGDIHGRLDLLDDLLRRIDDDMQRRSPRRTYIVFLGDLVDRGPDSRGVIDRLIGYRPFGAKPAFLAGNHEEAFLRVLEGEEEVLESWLRFGGGECLKSYGVDPESLNDMPPKTMLQRIRRQVPAAHVQFLKSFADSLRFGDYLFVHAGIRPNVPLEEQQLDDLRWIREPFLSHQGRHEFFVVHGHTVTPQVEELENRIGLDTGAYLTGRLSAVGLEDERRWFLAAEMPGDPR